MEKIKRTNYLIDSSFQIGFILRFLLVLLITIAVCFLVIIFYYYQDSLLGTNKLDQSVTIKTRGQSLTQEGFKIFRWDKEQITVYLKSANGINTYYCDNPFSNTNYKKDSIIANIDTSGLEPSLGPVSKETKMFFIVIYPLLWIFAAVCIIICIYSLFFSHRLAGPIYRVRVSLDRMINNDFDFKIKIRKNDFFTNIINKLEQLRSKIKNNELASPVSKEDLLEINRMLDANATPEEIKNKINEFLN